MNSPRHLKVFLCYAHDDKNAVIDLYQRLVIEGIDPWMDDKKLLAGQNWEKEIPKAVKQSDLVIVCLSKEFERDGYRQSEVRDALEALRRKPLETIFIIPALLEECEVPYTFQQWHWVKLFEKDGFRRLLKTLTVRAKEIGASTLLPGNPFRGLKPFREQDAEVFDKLGRSIEIDKALNGLSDANIRAVMIYGDPGVGKTSLIHAGILPRLGENEGWIVQHLRLGDLNPENPGDTESFIKKLNELRHEKNQNSLLVCDQIEYWYEQSKITPEAVMRLLSMVVKETSYKLLIGIRQEYVLEFDTRNYFSDQR